MQGSGAAVTSCSHETTVMAARGVCDHWQGNMLRPKIDGRALAAGSSPVKIYCSLKWFVIRRTCRKGGIGVTS